MENLIVIKVSFDSGTERLLSPPDVGSLTPNWVNNIVCVLYCFHMFLALVIIIAWKSIIVVGCFNCFAPHTTQRIIGVFLVRIHNNWRPPWGKGLNKLRYHG